MKTFKTYYLEEMSRLDQLQAALDVAGFEPTVIGASADVLNTIISGLRSASAETHDKRKEHIINAGISAISLIPFADVIKLLKLRKLGKRTTKSAISSARKLKAYGKSQQATGRFNNTQQEFKA